MLFFGKMTAQKQIHVDSLIGKYSHTVNLSTGAGTGCCSSTTEFEFKKNYEFKYSNCNDQGCYSTLSESSGFFVINDNTISLFSPLKLDDKIHSFYEKELSDSLFKITFRPQRPRITVKNIKRYFRFFSVNMNVEKNELKWVKVEPSQDSIRNYFKHINGEIPSLSFYFKRSQLSDFLSIEERSPGLNTGLKNTPAAFSLLIKTDISKSEENHVDLTKSKNLFVNNVTNSYFVNVSHYQFTFKGKKLKTTLKYYDMGYDLYQKRIFSKSSGTNRRFNCLWD